MLVEMRPALDGHGGIPQETRLIFRGLCGLPWAEVEGLLQSSNLVASKGLPLARGVPDARLPPDEQADRLSRVVVSLQQHQGGRLSRWGRQGGAAASWILHAVSGRAVRLTGFEPRRFEDFVWQSMFAKSLSPEDMPLVTARRHRLVSAPWSLAHRVGVWTRGLGHGLYPTLDTRGADVLLAETPFPGRVSAGTRLVVRYHDAVPLLLPHTIKNMRHHQAAHFGALRRNARDGAWFACVSEASRRDLLSVFPDLEPRAVTIPNMVSHHFRPETRNADRVPEILWARRRREGPLAAGSGTALPAGGPPLRYLLMVATLEPRKNHEKLLQAWELLRASGQGDLHLVLVGSPGWGSEALVGRLQPWLRERGGLHVLGGVPSDDLRLLYRHAAVTVCPSVAEGFDFPGVEAMRSGGVVAASDIPVHRDVFGEASEYFNPYAADDIAACLARLLSQPAARQALQARGAEVAGRYLPERVMPQWERFLEQGRRGDADLP